MVLSVIIICKQQYMKEVIMIKKLRSKLKKEGRTLVWFHRVFKISVSYNYMVQMLNSMVPMQKELEKAITKYIK